MGCDDIARNGGPLGPYERNRYFYGKLMTVRDFNTEQTYFDGKRRLLNRLVNGVGIVQGLGIKELVFQEGTLYLQARFEEGGCALDCCGREIVVPSVDGLFDVMWAGTNEHALPVNFEKGKAYYLYLQYEEVACEKVPCITSPTGCCPDNCCDNKFLETFSLLIDSKGPPPDYFSWARPINWEAKWQEESKRINDLAQAIWEERKGEVWKGIDFKKETDLTDWNDAKALVTASDAAKLLREQTCQGCNDKDMVLLAVVGLQGGNKLVVLEPETLEHRQLVYSNPLLHELLRSHLVDYGNPHNVTALQVDTTGGKDMLVQQINAGTGEKKIEEAHLDQTTLNKHIDNHINPHQVTAKQVDTQGGADMIVAQINAGRGMIETERLDLTQLNNHLINYGNPHRVTAKQVDDEGGGGKLIEQINSNEWGKIRGHRIDDYLVRLNQLEDHIKSDNPHHVRHDQVSPVAWSDGSDKPATRDKHLSHEDAEKWDKAVLTINTVPSAGGDLTIKQGLKIDVSAQPGQNSITISVEAGFVSHVQAIYGMLRERALKTVVLSFKSAGERLLFEDAAKLSRGALKWLQDYQHPFQGQIVRVAELEAEREKIFREAAAAISDALRSERFLGALSQFSSSAEGFKAAIADLPKALETTSMEIISALDEVCFRLDLLEKPKVRPEIREALARRIEPLPEQVKVALGDDQVAQLLNVLYDKKDGITVAQLTKASGLPADVVKASVEKLLNTLVTKSGTLYKITI